MSQVSYVEPVPAVEPVKVNFAEFSLKSMVSRFGMSQESADELHAFDDFRDAAGLVALVLRHWNDKKAFLAEIRNCTKEAVEPWQYDDIVSSVLLLVVEYEPEHELFTRPEGHFAHPRRRTIREEVTQENPMAAQMQALIAQIADLKQQVTEAASRPLVFPPEIIAAMEAEIEATSVEPATAETPEPVAEEPIDLSDEALEENPFEMPSWLTAPEEDSELRRRSISDDTDDEGLAWLVGDDADDGVEFVEPEVEETPLPAVPAPQKAHWLIRSLAWVDKQASKLNG